MKLGIVVTDDAYLNTVNDLIDAIRGRGWEAECFLTDTGVMALADVGFVRRAKMVPGSVSVCEHSVELYGHGNIDLAALSVDIIVGGQYQDTEMVRRCQKTLVF
jgi:hypothetical protein